VQQALNNRADLAGLVVAHDLTEPAVTVRSEQSVYSVLEKMSQHDCKELLVVAEEQGKQRVLAVLTSGDINAIYDEQILARKREKPPGKFSRLVDRLSRRTEDKRSIPPE